jgi:hypothetical protein
MVCTHAQMGAPRNRGEHDREVECAVERAAAVMTEAAKSLPVAEVGERSRR